MPLIAAAAAAAASAVVPPPPRRVSPLRSRSLGTRRRGILSLTVTSCSPSPPPAVVAAEAPVAPLPQEAKPKPRRYPKQYPGESVGVAEEMRFVAMRLRNPKRTTIKDKAGTENADAEAEASEEEEEEDEEEEDGGGGVKEEHEKEEEGEIEAGEWMPSMEGFVRYLVDSELVFGTIERVVAESTDVAYVYFRKSGLERSASISKDLEWFRKQGIAIPEPSTSGSTYAAYLTELAESNAPAFLSHYYNIYFAHITGGVAIGNKICKKILEGRELEFYKWDTDAELLLKDAREKLNDLSKHWTRKDRNLCLKEAAKCFQYLGKMIRLIIL